VSLLCRRYYDRLYSESKPGQTDFVLTVDSSNSEKAADEIQDFVRQRLAGADIKSPV